MAKILEVCVDNYESALQAMSGGANRLELCSALHEGGLTPTPGLLKQIQSAKSRNILVFCMIRCRSANFVYSEDELKIMVEDTKILKQHGADGFVFGALLENGDVDLRKCREIVKTGYPLPVTFHRAFDVCRNPVVQLEVIIDLGFQRILTSGTKETALDGCKLIKQYMKRTGNRIIIMPGAGINKNNIKEIMDATDATEYHGSFKIPAVSKSSDLANDIKHKLDLGSVLLTDATHVSEIVHILKMCQG